MKLSAQRCPSEINRPKGRQHWCDADLSQTRNIAVGNGGGKHVVNEGSSGAYCVNCQSACLVGAAGVPVYLPALPIAASFFVVPGLPRVGGVSIVMCFKHPANYCEMEHSCDCGRCEKHKEKLYCDDNQDEAPLTHKLTGWGNSGKVQTQPQKTSAGIGLPSVSRRSQAAPSLRGFSYGRAFRSIERCAAPRGGKANPVRPATRDWSPSGRVNPISRRAA